MKRVVQHKQLPGTFFVPGVFKLLFFQVVASAILATAASAAYQAGSMPADTAAAAPGAFLEKALVQLHAGHTAMAQKDFEAYIGQLPEKEQAVYRDITPVATKAELAQFKQTPDGQKAEWIRTFWKKRDPSPKTDVNEALLEHWRRVAFAREHYGKTTFPWDDRGAVYVRLGAPDHISRSSDVQIEGVRAVQNARLNFANQFYPGLIVVPGEPSFPVSGLAKWAYWVYANIDGGTEFTFVNPYKGDRYTFAPVPTWISPFVAADLQQYQGDNLLEHIASK